MTILQDAMFQVPHLPLPVTQVSKESIKAFSHSKKVGGYLLGRTLGVGSFAKVKEGLHISTGEKAAVKIIDKKRAKNDNYVRKNLRREGKLLQAVRHPNIVALLEIMETDNSYYLVTELCKGGDLMDYISVRKRLQEKEVLKFIRQIVSAVDYLHKVGIIHRDLKIENLLLDGNNDIKLIDFGLSNFVKVSEGCEGSREGELCSTQCGSPAYAAPELLNHEQYGWQVDSWSIGVNMFAMLTGGLPFTVEPFNIKALYVKMRDGQMNPVPEGLTKECRDLLRKFLTPDPSRRVTIEQALVHPWLTHGNSQPVARTPCPNKLKTSDLNTDILSHMSDNLGFRMGEVIKFVTCNTPSAACATYHLYLTRLKRYLQEAEGSTKKSGSTGKKNGVLDNRRFPKDPSQRDIRNVKNSTMINNNDINCNNGDMNNNDKNNADSETPSVSSSPSPHPKFKDEADYYLAQRDATTATPGGEVCQKRDESPVSAWSDPSESNSPKENSIQCERSQQTDVNPSPHPTSNQIRKVSLQAQREVKLKTQVPAIVMRRPRLYKRRGETTLSTNIPDKLSGEVRETIQVLDVQKTPRETTGVYAVSRSEGISDLALSRITSPSHTTKQAPGDQARRDCGVGGIGSSHLGTTGGASVRPGYNSTPNNRCAGIDLTMTSARDAVKTPASFLQRLSDVQRRSLSGQGDDRGEIRALGTVDGNVRHITQSHLQNKKISLLAKRAATLKSMEVKPAPSPTQGNDNMRGRLQEVDYTQRRGNNSNKSGRPNPQIYRVIPRPFIPFRSAHERSNGLSKSYPHQIGSSQKAKTFEALTLDHDKSDLSSRRVPGTPVTAGEDPNPGPPRPVIVRKRLAKRHRLGEVHSLQPSLIHDIEQTVTEHSFAGPGATTPDTHSKKASQMNESLSSPR
ncbi:hypothetical protein EGW08_011118 [Elysia chlorotica]|uniref:non-specific serine/threonine protein kinase n=1 Tax=Elysia chlorotica TaxID=188477 RepID=A0A3S1C2I5_ELYCH|nr:hypothetical protein EGW08_011118 [Elysia chlorotica]